MENINNAVVEMEMTEEEQSTGCIPVQDFTLMQARQEIVDFILNNSRGVLVVDVPTGGGKTYGLPWIIKNDILSALPKTRVIMLEAHRAVTEDVRKHLQKDVLGEPVGMKLGRDEGMNYQGERFSIGTTGASFALVREGEWSVVILDEFDLDQNGDVAIMHNQLYHMLKRVEAQGERLVVVLPSATPDIENAKKFYREFTFKVLEVKDRIYDPDILAVNIGSGTAESFKDILEKYADVLAQLCGVGYQGRMIPKGKNVLCTIPSPVYFEELETKICDLVNSDHVEVVKVWSRSTPSEKRKLFGGGTPGKTTIFLATDLIRRGGTPDIYAAFPSGWQVRDFCDPDSGIEGTREERSSQADYRQDEGRCSRKERGLVIRSIDHRRPATGMTFLERKLLDSFLLNLIHYEDIRYFKWWGEVSEKKIADAVANLKRFGAVEEKDDGRVVLTSLGRAMRGLPGSVRMRSMVFAADQADVLAPFLVITAGISQMGNLLVNAKDKPNVLAAQAPLRVDFSDYLSVLRVWGVISDAISSGLRGALASADHRIEKKKRDTKQKANEIRSKIQKNWSLPKKERFNRLNQVDADLKEHLALIELTRPREREEAIIELVQRFSGGVGFKYGLYKKGIESFVRTILQSASFLNGKKYKINGSPEKTIEINVLDILSMGMETVKEIEEQNSDQIHRVVLGGYADSVFRNVPFKGELGYFYRKIGQEGSDSISIFPGSSAFARRGEYLVGTPVNRKDKKFLENVFFVTPEQLVRWLPEVAPQLVKIEEGIDPFFDPEKDSCVSTTLFYLSGHKLKEEELETPEHDQASSIFAGWLASQMV